MSLGLLLALASEGVVMSATPGLFASEVSLGLLLALASEGVVMSATPGRFASEVGLEARVGRCSLQLRPCRS